MASTVNVGTLQGVLAMRDEFSAQLQKFETRIKAAEAKVQGFSRTQKSEADKIRDAYNKVAASLDPTIARTQKYERTVETLNRALKAGIINQSQYNAQIAKAQIPLQQATHWTQRLGASIGGELSGQFTRFFAVSALITLGLGSIISVSKQFIQANIEAEGTSRRVEEAIRRYGERSGVTAEQIDDIAASISRLTGLDDELIADAEIIGLKFNRIGSEIFPRFARVATDVGVSIGDIGAGFEKAGKLVNQPLRALTLFAREGYAVAKSQSDLVKSLVAAGEIEAAQVEILKILESQYGGTAEAARDTMGGALGALGVAWENLLEKLGEDHTGPIRDVIETIIQLLNTVTDHIDDVSIAWNEFVANLIRGDLIIQKIRGFVGADDAAQKSVELRKQLAERESALAKLYAKRMVEQGLLSEDLAKKLGLLSDGHRKSSRGALEQTESESKLNRELERARQVTQQVYDNIGKLLDQALEQAAAYRAAIQGQKAYNEELLRQKISHAIIAEENKLRVVGKTLTSDQRKQIEAAIRATETFKDKTDLLVQSWGRLANLSDIEIKVPDFSQIPSINQSVMEIGVSINATVNEEFTAEWDEFAEAVRDSLKTDMEALEEYELRVKIARDLAKQAGDVERVALMEEELNHIREEGVLRQIDKWGGFFSFLGNALGGVFQQISQAISNIQSAYQGGQQLGSLTGMSGMGGIFATAAVFMEIYKAVSADIKRDRARTWSDVTSLSVTGGQFSSPSYFSQTGREMSLALEQMVRDLVDSLDAVLRDLPKIVIRARKDQKEFSAYVAGVFVGTFRDAQSALEAAVATAIQQADFSAISEEFRIALEASIGATMDELQRNLDTARSARRARLGDTGSQYVEVADTWRQEIDAARRLGLAVDDMIKARDRELSALKNSVLGIDTTVSDQLAALGSLNRGIAEASTGMRASMEEQIRALMEQIAYMEGRGPGDIPRRSGEEGGGSGGRVGGGYAKDAQSEWEETLARLRTQLAEYLEELDKIPQALSDQELDMGIIGALLQYLETDKRYRDEAIKLAKWKVDIEFELIKARLMELGKWEQFAGMFNDAYAAAQRAAGQVGRGGGRGGGERESARDFVRDRRFELSLVGLTDYQRSLAELDKQYDDLIAQAGKDKKLRAELLDLRAQEIALLEREERARVGKEFKDFVSPASQFGSIREVANALIKDIEQSPFGNPRKAAMIGRVLAEVDKQISRLSREEAANLFGAMIGDMEKFGISEQQMSEMRRSMAVLEHTLNVENYRTRIAILRAEGNLAPAILAQLEAAFNIVSGIDVGKWFDSSQKIDFVGEIDTSVTRPIADAVDNVEDELNRLAEAFKDAKEDIRLTLEEIARGGMGIVTPQAAFDAAKEQYDAVMSKARSGQLVGFQESSDSAKNYIEALKQFSPALAAVQLPNIQRDLTQLLQANTVRDENLIFTEKFAKNQEQTNKTLTAGFTDLSNTSHEQSEIQSRMLSQIQDLNANLTDNNARLSRLESARQAERREVA